MSGLLHRRTSAHLGEEPPAVHNLHTDKHAGGPVPSHSLHSLPPRTCAPSASAAMTLPSMKSERLMLVVSRRVSPMDLLSRRRSLPARSTNDTWARGRNREREAQPLAVEGNRQRHLPTHAPGQSSRVLVLIKADTVPTPPAIPYPQARPRSVPGQLPSLHPPHLAVARHAVLVVIRPGGSAVNVHCTRHVTQPAAPCGEQHGRVA